MSALLQRRAKAIIHKQSICPWCLGRILSEDSTRFEEMGVAIYKSMGDDIPVNCVLCKGIPTKRNLIQKLLDDLSLYNFKTFIIGIILDQSTLRKDEDLLLKGSTSLKRGLSSFLINELETKLAKVYNPHNPDILVMLNLRGNPQFEILMKPIIISINYAKYDKLVEIRASTCNKCQGVGCKSCNFTGKMHDMSFESYLLYDLPLQLNSSTPKITWTTREYDNSNIYGKGKILYIEINRTFDPIKAPLLITNEPIKGMRILCAKKINKKDIKRFFIQTLEITVSLQHINKAVTMKMEKKFRNKDLILEGATGKKWIKRIYWIKFVRIGKKTIFRVKCDSGINIYSWLGIDKPTLSKQVSPKIFKKSEVKILNIDLLDQD